MREREVTNRKVSLGIYYCKPHHHECIFSRKRLASPGEYSCNATAAGALKAFRCRDRDSVGSSAICFRSSAEQTNDYETLRVPPLMSKRMIRMHRETEKWNQFSIVCVILILDRNL